MKNLKKVMALVIVLSMLVSMFTVMTASAADFEDVIGTVYEEAVMTLAPMGVIAGYEEGESILFKPENIVTRAEMAAFIVRQLGLSAAAKADTDFTDVPKEFWGSGAIKIANTKNIIVGYGDGTFGPNDPVSFEAAVKMIVCALGYEEDAKENGGWPVGYITVAEKAPLELLDGLEDKLADTTAGCDRGTVALLLYNALDEEIQEVTYYNGEVLSKLPSGKSMLYHMGYGKYEDVIVERTDKATISEYMTTPAKDGEVSLSGALTGATVKDGGFDLNELLGRPVTVYTSYNQLLKEHTIVAVVESKKADIQVLNIDDIVDAGTNNRITFYVDKESSSKTDYFNVAGLGSLSMVFNNNAIPSVDQQWAYIKDNASNYTNGTVTLIDAMDDGIYERVLIDTYQNFQISRVDTKNNKLSLIFTGDNSAASVELEDNKETNYTKYEIFDAEGNALELADLEEDTILSIYSDNYGQFGSAYLNNATTLKMIASTETVEGVITQQSSSGGKVYIDGEVYYLSAEQKAQIGEAEYELDAEGIYFLDFNGEVAYADADPALENFEYVYDGIALGRDIKLYTLTSTGEKVVREMASTVKLNGTPYHMNKSGEEEDGAVNGRNDLADELLINGSDGLTNMYIASIRTNASGQVNRIDVVGAQTDATQGVFSKSDAMLGEYMLTDNTVIFSRPAGDDYDEEDLKVISKDSLTNDKKYQYIIYNINEKNEQVTAMVILSTDADVDSNADIAVIQSVSTIKDGDDTVLSLTMIQGGKIVTKKTEALDTLAAPSNPEYNYGNSAEVAYGAYPGQIILYTTNSSGAITDKTYRLYPRHASEEQASDDKYYQTMKFKTWDYSLTEKVDADLVIVAGKVDEINAKTGALTIDSTDMTKVKYTNARVVVYDGLMSSEELKVRVGDFDDIDENDYVVVRLDKNTAKDIVVYKADSQGNSTFTAPLDNLFN